MHSFFQGQNGYEKAGALYCFTGLFFFFFYKSEITEIYKPFWKKHEIKEKSCYQERERGGSSGFGW